MSGLKLNIAIVCAVLLATLSSAAPAVSSALVASTVSASNPALSPSSAPLSSSLVPASSAAASVDSSSAKASSIASAAPASETVPYASDDPNEVMWGPDYDGDPQPIRGTLGSTVMGPQDAAIDIQNPDLFAPPTTDAGTVGNAKWPFSLSHNRLQTGGWARQQNVAVLPMATELAGVDMRLEAGAIRELHWHKTSEWAYVLQGSVQVTAVNPDGQNFVGTVDAGDLWFFPAGTPHSLQATDADPDGAEFLLVFDDGSFSEDSTFLLTDWLAHVPKEVLARNFQTDISAFNDIPGQQLYIFPGSAPGPDSDVPTSPQGSVPSPFTFKMSQMKATQLSGGSVKVVDSRTFPISITTAAAEVTVQPGAMRELHWHPTQDEWSFFLEGNARVTLFASQGAARTYNFQAGDVGYVPGTYGHYVENIGNTTLRFLEIFKTDTFQDVSLSQWLALTPPAMVQATLNLNDEAMSHLSKIKQTVVGPASGSSK
ncbi:hypothetical protein EW026_g2444 [Hermanssonia centrifuga]|uniref:Cupin type-1 domain-containing protein n=1 Tax=Hermanssonia centrifuga TaxID=98765 RepID=A0A4S4KQC9_9APHY|nr:hypothetical protein EW026_g2444 [Hermanssonia centrifuga]